jgi:hypothetical protein
VAPGFNITSPCDCRQRTVTTMAGAGESAALGRGRSGILKLAPAGNPVSRVTMSGLSFQTMAAAEKPFDKQALSSILSSMGRLALRCHSQNAGQPVISRVSSSGGGLPERPNSKESGRSLIFTHPFLSPGFFAQQHQYSVFRHSLFRPRSRGSVRDGPRSSFEGGTSGCSHCPCNGESRRQGFSVRNWNG